MLPIQQEVKWLKGIAKKLYPNCIIQSAGSVPKEVNPNAILVMSEIDIDISKHY